MDAVSLAVAAAFGVVGSLIGQWMLGIFDTEPEQQRPVPLGPPPALRGRRPRMSDIMSHVEQLAAMPEPESRYIQMESPGCAVACFTFEDDCPRTFRIVSRDLFDTLDKVTVYEMAAPEVK